MSSRDPDGARPGPVPSRGRKLLFVGFAFGAFLLLLLAIEGVVRLALPPISPLQFFVQGVRGATHGDDPDGARTFEGDALLGWRLRPDLRNQYWDFLSFSTNGDHLRHPRELEDKPSNGFRVVCVGDSVTFGYRVPRSRPDEPMRFDPAAHPYPRLLEQRLRDGDATKPIDVIALAVPGYTSHQGLGWLERDIARLKPDLVTVSFGWNDTFASPLEDKVTLSRGALRVFLRRVAAHSQAILHLARWLRGPGATSPAPDAPGVRVSSGDHIKNLMRIASLAAEHGAGVIVIGQVYRDTTTDPAQAERVTRYRTLLAAACRERGIPYLEIPELTETSSPANHPLFGDPLHPNAEGHRLIATRLLSFARERGMVGE